MALLSKRAGLRRYAVPNPVTVIEKAVIEKVIKPDPAGTLRRCQYAP
jgi:hypothetical protein